ncbi:MAG TPA: ABC transporter permease, partial [Limnochordia bacterium]|nr:ABC transporter permease [Limnochordia bacterium]
MSHPVERRLDATYQLRVLRTFLRRDLKLWTYFRFNFAIDLMGIVSNAVIYGLIAHFGAGAGRNGYATYVVAGLIFNALANAALTAPYQGLMQAFWSNRLELLMMSPVSLPVFVIGTSLQPYVRALIEAALYVALGVLLFGVSLSAPPAPLVFVAALLLGLAAISGLGLIGASLVYHLDARGGQDPLRLFVGILAGL